MKFSLSIFFLVISQIFSWSQQSENMTLLDRWEVDTLPLVGSVQFNDVWGYVDCEGTEYAILGSTGRVHFISLADPSNAQEVASFEGGELSIWRDMKTYGDRAYSVSENTNEGLMIFDLSDLPNGVTKSNQTNEYFGKAHNIYIDVENGRLYVVGTDTQAGGVMIFDLTNDPDNPTLLASIDLPADPITQTGYVHDIFVQDNIAYASHGFLGFFIWDMNEPTQPILLASRETGGYNHSSWISEDGSFAIYAEEVPKGRPLGVMNLENLSNEIIEIDTTFKFPLLQNDLLNTPHNPFIRGDYLICSYYEDGLVVFDVSDPMNAQRVAYYDTYPTNTNYNGTTGNWGAYPYLPSGILLASDVATGLYILELDQSISLANIDSPTLPDVSNIFQESIETCDPELIWELPSDGNMEYTWFKDGAEIVNDNPFITITESGTYSAKINNLTCESFTNEAVVTFIEGPDFSSLPTQEMLACEGEIFTFEIPDEYDYYVWYLNQDSIGDSNFINVGSSGEYHLEASVNGCTETSNPFTLSFSETPNIEITAQGPTAFCEGMFLNLMAISNSPDVSYSWNLDTIILGNDALLPVTDGGVYEIIVTNSNGCSNSETIEITVYQPEIPEISLDGNLLTSTPANYYQWFFNGSILTGANNQSLAVTEVGEYYVGTVDDNGCFGNSTPINVDVVSNNNLANVNALSIFPNPVNELLQLNFDLNSSDNFSIEILNLDGKILFEKNTILQETGQVEINVSNFSTGVYFIKIKNSEGQLVRKFVKI